MESANDEFDFTLIVARLFNEAVEDDRCAPVAEMLAAAWQNDEWEPARLLARLRDEAPA